jgi:hypothetical protein
MRQLAIQIGAMPQCINHPMNAPIGNRQSSMDAAQ